MDDSDDWGKKAFKTMRFNGARPEYEKGLQVKGSVRGQILKAVHRQILKTVHGQFWKTIHGHNNTAVKGAVREVPPPGLPISPDSISFDTVPRRRGGYPCLPRKRAKCFILT